MFIIKSYFSRIIPKRAADRLRYFTHVLACIPVIILAYNAWMDNLTANPIQAATQRTGLTAITLLGLSLACTPLNLVFRWRFILPLRRTLGLYAFLYALLHMILFTVIDYGLDLELIFGSIAKKPYVIVGATGFLVLTLLAFTSFDWWKKKLGKNWKRLHAFVYPAALILGLHFAWALKGDIFKLSGDVFWPSVYILLISLFLIMRIPTVKKLILNQSVKPVRRIIPLPPVEESKN
jgi:sulfoxide reductase heme-binding subunit YedZ